MLLDIKATLTSDKFFLPHRAEDGDLGKLDVQDVHGLPWAGVADEEPGLVLEPAHRLERLDVHDQHVGNPQRSG